MSKNLEKKKQIVSETVSLLNKESPSTLVLDYSTISANEMNELRAKLFEKDATLKIVKNTLISKALKEVGIEIDKKDKRLTGQNAILVAKNDFISTIKDIYDFIKTKQKGQVQFAVVDGELLDTEKTKALSMLPSKEELLGQVLRGMMSPIRGFAFALNDTQSKFVRVLSAIKDSK